MNPSQAACGRLGPSTRSARRSPRTVHNVHRSPQPSLIPLSPSTRHLEPVNLQPVPVELPRTTLHPPRTTWHPPANQPSPSLPPAQ
eukprot:940444-Prymnesium_polylepis.2